MWIIYSKTTTHTPSQHPLPPLIKYSQIITISIMPLFPTYDISSNSIILTIYDPINNIFFDPTTNKNYDYPFVFKNELDLQLNLPHLLSNLLSSLQSQILSINTNITNISTLLIQLKYPNENIFFIHNPNTNTNIPFIYNNNIPHNPINNTTPSLTNTIHNIPTTTNNNIILHKQFNTFIFKPS